jgi:enamine deaminase RidA (YjgF/YER057c/UK114 family)
MPKQIVNPDSLARPSGFSHGIVTDGGRMLFLAGQPGVDATGKVASPGDLVAQFTQAIANLKTVVESAGGQPADIVKLTIYVLHRDDYKNNLKPIGRAYSAVFGRYYPATTLVEVRDLFDDDALIEIDGIAVLPAAPAM